MKWNVRVSCASGNSTSSTGGNQVGGLPAASSTGASSSELEAEKMLTLVFVCCFCSKQCIRSLSGTKLSQSQKLIILRIFFRFVRALLMCFCICVAKKHMISGITNASSRRKGCKRGSKTNDPKWKSPSKLISSRNVKRKTMSETLQTRDPDGSFPNIGSQWRAHSEQLQTEDLIRGSRVEDQERKFAGNDPIWTTPDRTYQKNVFLEDTNMFVSKLCRWNQKTLYFARANNSSCWNYVETQFVGSDSK